MKQIRLTYRFILWCILAAILLGSGINCVSGAASTFLVAMKTPTADNTAPVLDSIGAKAVDEGASLTFTATATDAGDVIVFSSDSLPTGAALDSAGHFQWIPTYAQAGVYDVNITVTDDGAPPLSDTEKITITVSNVEEPAGETYYVDPVNGLDTNDGSTPEEAWQTLTKVGTGSSAGDTINILNADTTIFYPYSNDGATDYVEWPDRYYHSSKIIQWGITVNFSESERIGRFINGDYWVLGPFTISSYTPAAYVYSGQDLNGMMADNNAEGHGFDSRCAGYDVTRNAGKQLPYLISGQISPMPIIIVTSHTDSSRATTYHSWINAGMVFTAVNTAIANNTYFRPGYRRYTGQSPTEYPWSGVNTAKLGSVDLQTPYTLRQTAGEAQYGSLERRVERPWIEVRHSYTGQYTRPLYNMYAYGKQIQEQSSYVALALHDSKWTISQRTQLLKRYIQVGIDYGSIYRATMQTKAYGDIHMWDEGGGFSFGRYWPILFAGIMLNDPNLYNIGSDSAQDDETHTDPNYMWFGENARTLEITSGMVATTPYSITSYEGLRDATGTVSVTKGQTLVTGLVGDNWSSVAVGDHFMTSTDEVRLVTWNKLPYVVASKDSVSSPPTITLTEAYEGETNIAAGFCLALTVYVGNQYDCKSTSDKDLAEFTLDWVGRSWQFTWGNQLIFTEGDPYCLEGYSKMISPTMGWTALAACIMNSENNTISLWNHPSFFEAVDEFYERQTLSFGSSTDTTAQTWAEYAMHAFWDTYYAP